MNGRKFALFMIDLSIISIVCAIFCYIFPSIDSVAFVEDNIGLKIALLMACLLLMRCAWCIYSSIWRYACVRSYLKLIISDYSVLILMITIGRWIPEIYIGASFTSLCVMIANVITLLSRFVYQELYAYLNRTKEQDGVSRNKINIAIIGAGNVGTMLADELLRNPRAHYYPYCFIDTDIAKRGNRVHGIKIYSPEEATVDFIKTLPIQEIVIALPDANADTKARLYDRYLQTGCKVKLYDYSLDKDSVNPDKRTLREFKIEDLLFRDTIALQSQENASYYYDKTVMVTGGGGSIGSELCRQIAKCRPKMLIIVDIYENNAYDIQQELLRKYGNFFPLQVRIASVRDVQRMDAIFATYRPDVVFHAAAHKHVPLMEDSPQEAVKNNVFGTYNVANAAEKYGVEKFILISTDKAVNPTNMMGASKRLCEMVIQCRRNSHTEFTAVRFGNVLGSNGSVIPLFKQQIANGGPITLTDKRIIRYFMTIPEAVSLVMEAGRMAHSGELFVLDMGKPVKILDLAEKMIYLSGFTPYEDIDIQEIGLRPGEKLYEELLIKTEQLDRTENNMIFIERDRALSREEVEQKLAHLRDALSKNDEQAVAQAIRDTVPTYSYPEICNENAHLAEEMKHVRDTVTVG